MKSPRLRLTLAVAAIAVVALLAWWVVTRDSLPVVLILGVLLAAAAVYFVESGRNDPFGPARKVDESRMRRSTPFPPERPRF